MEICNSVSWEVKILYCACGVCGQGILRCKCGIVNLIYVTGGVGGYNLIWQVWCVCGQGLLRYICGKFNWKYVTVGVGRL